MIDVIDMLASAKVLADAKGFEDVGKLELGRVGQVHVEVGELRWFHSRIGVLIVFNCYNFLHVFIGSVIKCMTHRHNIIVTTSTTRLRNRCTSKVTRFMYINLPIITRPLV